MNTQIDSTDFDVRDIPCRIKHGQIIQRWLELPVGQHFVLINDHEPVPLYYQFDATFPGEFSWERLEASEDCFKIKITRLAPAKNAQLKVTNLPSGCGSDATPGEIDVRGLEPPAPMMEILKAVESLLPGGTLRAHTDRQPLHLHPELEARQLRYNSEVQPDGSWLTTITRA